MQFTRKYVPVLQIQLVIFANVSIALVSSFETVVQWKTALEYTDYGDFKDYLPENNILGNVRSFKGRIYVTVPRWRNGVPSTLNTLKSGDKTMLLQPFPNLQSNRVGQCKTAMQNVASLEIDPEGFLWALDLGTSAFFSRPNHLCSAKLVKINLNGKDQGMEIIHTFERNVIPKDSFILHMAYDGDRFYFADSLQGKIIIFDLVSMKSIIIDDQDVLKPVNTPVKLDGNDNDVPNQRFGVSGIALQENRIFFGRLSPELYSIPTPGREDSKFKLAPTKIGTRLTKCEAMTANNMEHLYMAGLEVPNRIYKWNVSETLESKNMIIIADNLNISWINSIWIEDGHLWFSNNRFNAFTSGTMEFSLNNINFGIYRVKLKHNEKSYLHQFISHASITLSSLYLTTSLIILINASF